MPVGNRSASAQKILDTAKNLFWKYGIKRVTVEEICAEAGVSKMTFYRKFKNKHELVMSLLTTIYERGMADYQEIMQRDIPFPEKVKAIVLLKHQSSQNLSAEFMNDLYQSDDAQLQALMANYAARSQQQTRKDFLAAQQDGWIRADLKMDSIFYLLSVIQEKLFDPAYAALHENPHDAIMELTNFFFYGVLSSSKTEGEV
jgi:AcrR family transcriptional regulator